MKRPSSAADEVKGWFRESAAAVAGGGYWEIWKPGGRKGFVDFFWRKLAGALGSVGRLKREAEADAWLSATRSLKGVVLEPAPLALR